MLGQILPEMPSLHRLTLTGVHGSILQPAEMKALFGGINKTIPLDSLIFIGFSMRGPLAPLLRSLRFFPNLSRLYLKKLNMDEHDLHGLVQELNLSSNPLGHAVTSIVPYVITSKKLQCLCIDNTGQSEKDLNYVRDTVQQALPQLEIMTDKKSVPFVDIGFLD